MMQSTVTPFRTGRRGFLSLELVLTLPVLMIVLFALFEFSLLLFVRSDVLDAARHGARLAANPTVHTETVVTKVRRRLTPRLRETADVFVVPGARSGDMVRVRVTVPMNKAAPDLLWPIGYSLKGRTLSAEVRMIKE